MRGPVRVLWIAALLAACGGAPIADHTAVVQRGHFRSTFTETGNLRALRYTPVTVPWYRWEYGEPQVQFLEEEGRHVREGDIVARLESSGVLRVLETKQAETTLAYAELEKQRVEQETRLKQLTGDLRSAEAALESARIDTQRVQYEPSAKQEIARLQLRIAGTD